MPLTKPRVKCIGILRPDAVYTAKGLMRYGGVGEKVLRRMRLSGEVIPRDEGNQRYYLGSEVIGYIVKHATKRT